MKIEKIVGFILPLLFIVVNGGSMYNETVFAEIQGKFSNAYTKCFKFVIGMRKKKLEPPPYYEWSRGLLKVITEDPNEEYYKDYLNTTFANHKSASAFITALTGLPAVNSLVRKTVFNAVTMICCYLFIKYFPFVFGSVSRFFTWVRHFKLSTMIPVYMSYFLIANTLQFANSTDEALKHLTISKAWFRDFSTHHSFWIRNKTVQVRCLMNEYFDGMEIFRNMSAPFPIYQRLVNNTDNLFLSKYSLLEFRQQFFPNGDLSDEQLLYDISYWLMDTLHNQLSEKETSDKNHRLVEYGQLFRGFTDKVLQLPSNGLLSNYRNVIWLFTIITLLIVFAVCYAPFMEDYVLKEKILTIVDYAQNVMMVAIVVKTGMFIYLLSRVAHVQMVQSALLDANMTLLDGLVSKQGINLRQLFMGSQRENLTITEALYQQQYFFDADPEMFLFNVNADDFKFLEQYFPIDNTSTVPEFQNVTSVTEIFDIRGIQRALLNELKWPTEEDYSYFTNLIFGYNYNRFATSMLKYIIVPVSTPVWSLILMPIFHFVIAIWIMFALPYVMITQIEQDI